MGERTVRKCECFRCQQPGHNGIKELHAQFNEYLSTLEEPRRLELLAWESLNPSYGGELELEKITGVPAADIAKMRWSMYQSTVRYTPSFASYSPTVSDPFSGRVTYTFDEDDNIVDIKGNDDDGEMKRKYTY